MAELTGQLLMDEMDKKHWQMWHNVNRGYAWIDCLGERYFYSDPMGQNELSETDLDIILHIDAMWFQFVEDNPTDAKNIIEGLT